MSCDHARTPETQTDCPKLLLCQYWKINSKCHVTTLECQRRRQTIPNYFSFVNTGKSMHSTFLFHFLFSFIYLFILIFLPSVAQFRPYLGFILSIGELILRRSISFDLNNNFYLLSALVRILELRVLVVIDNSKIASADSITMSKNYRYHIAYFSKITVCCLCAEILNQVYFVWTLT